MILLHTFFTNGLMDFARIYLESFRLHHGDEITVLAETRDLTDAEIAELESLYPNLIVRNKPLDFAQMSALSGIGESQLREWKDEVEHEVTTIDNYRWKLLMSVEARYRSLLGVFQEFRAKGYTTMIHTDIDTYFRGSILGLDRMLEDYDVVVPIRKKKAFKNTKKRGRIWGCLIALKMNDRAEAFLRNWHQRIVETPFQEKPKGFGQYSLYDAYLELQSDVAWGNLYADPRGPKITKITDDVLDDREALAAQIWAGNSNAGRNRKDLSAQRFRVDMQGSQPGDAPTG